MPRHLSSAGNGHGLDGERSGMWREMARIIGEVRPRYAFVENSPMLVTRGLERVLADLTAMGYDSRNGELYLLPRTLVHHHSKRTGYGLSERIPTPNAWDGKRGPMRKELMETGFKHQVSLVTYVKQQPRQMGDTQRTGFSIMRYGTGARATLESKYRVCTMVGN
jgi:hypothetical protein